MIDLIECPRDAMQGFARQIPTATKIAYLNQLLRVGFHTLDFGSFVSPKAVPQMADTAEVLAGLDLGATDTRLLAIVANQRGVEAACQHPEIHYLGYPFSLSETFQQRNTHHSLAQSLELVKAIQAEASHHQKELVVYLSMAFGNPYGDPWNVELVEAWTEKMVALGIKTIALADTVGSAEEETIRTLFGTLLRRFPQVTLGAHFHAQPHTRTSKVMAAWEAGCRRFDVAMQGFGGCPFAKDELVGNIATESIVSFCQSRNIETGLQVEAFNQASAQALAVFA
jgi:hydroxymethylglutaryl-CoA lyase